MGECATVSSQWLHSCAVRRYGRSVHRTRVQTAADETPDVMAALAARVERLEALLFAAERWVSVGETARLLGVHRSTVHRMISTGQVPVRRWRGRCEIDPTWVATEAASRTRHKDTT